MISEEKSDDVSHSATVCTGAIKDSIKSSINFYSHPSGQNRYVQNKNIEQNAKLITSEQKAACITSDRETATTISSKYPNISSKYSKGQKEKDNGSSSDLKSIRYYDITGLNPVPEYDEIMTAAMQKILHYNQSNEMPARKKSKRQIEQDKGWLRMFHKLLIYKSEYNGETNVPQYHRPDQMFGNWCAKQRELLRDSREGKSNLRGLSEDQKLLLESVNFFVGRTGRASRKDKTHALVGTVDKVTTESLKVKRCIESHHSTNNGKKRKILDSNSVFASNVLRR